MARALMPSKVVLFALLYILIFAAYVINGTRPKVVAFKNHHRVNGFSISKGEQFKQGSGKNKKYARRMMIGSTAPNCTYNECSTSAELSKSQLKEMTLLIVLITTDVFVIGNKQPLFRLRI